ncbi:hypothetical protein Kuja_0830 [Vibrio phage vB_VchM_Kuja]|uniref:Uncharacterized protein n=1 Tax=Vibrio phage vB_VchM_Kuja TaxID=2686437 RepID=A0A6B9J7R0_9CAUD|nr:hypothetical protein HWC83_gp153 [Vibrio phage vB_VchM_Kuja]QGZ16074.1 hypothetical protein Kuja_0830 [Vibrio phage vB_VchM_Kuja]
MVTLEKIRQKFPEHYRVTFGFQESDFEVLDNSDKFLPLMISPELLTNIHLSSTPLLKNSDVVGIVHSPEVLPQNENFVGIPCRFSFNVNETIDKALVKQLLNIRFIISNMGGPNRLIGFYVFENKTKTKEMPVKELAAFRLALMNLNKGNKNGC